MSDGSVGGVGPSPSSGTGRDTPGSFAWLADLVAVVLLTVLTAVLLLVPVTPQPLIWLLGIPFLILFPGYAAIAVLFPKHGGRTPPSEVRPDEPPSFIARLALAIVLSPVLIAIVGLALSPMSAIRLEPVVYGLTALILFCTLLAVIRRARLPAEMRAGVPSASIRSTLALPGSRSQNIVLVLSLFALAGVVIAAVAIPPESEAYTETYLLSENDDGELVAEDFPTNMTTNESYSLAVGLENHENQQMDYEVFTVLQDLDDDGAITDQERLDNFERELDDGEEVTTEQTFSPSLTGELRLQVLVYEDTTPETLTVDNADHRLEFWVTVEGNETADNGD